MNSLVHHHIHVPFNGNCWGYALFSDTLLWRVFLFCWLIFRQWQAHKFYLICFHSKKSLKRQCTRCLRLKSIAPIPLNPLSILFRHIQPIWLVAMPNRLTLDSTHILEPSYINIYGYGSIPKNTIFRGMNIHLPAILMFTRGTRFWHTAI